MDEVRPRARAEAPPAVLWLIALAALIPFPASALMYAYGPELHRAGSLTMLKVISDAPATSTATVVELCIGEGAGCLGPEVP